jgi:hypothetical protein
MRRIVVCALVVATAVPVATAAGQAAPAAGAATFAVGAAVETITPPPAGTLAHDPAACSHDPVYDGAHRFALEEPYIDVAHVGTFQAGDPYVDCNGNGRWDGIMLGGGGNSPRFATTVADTISARAIAVSNGPRTIVVEVLDNEGVFNVYQARIRAKVAADGYRTDGVFISATHDESAPDTIGISGVDQVTSGVDAYYADFMVSRAAIAIERALQRRAPARIRYAEAIEPENLRQCFSSYPFVDDQLMPTLQAVGLDGRVIATLADVSQHAETLGFNPDPEQQRWISGDWPHFFRSALESRYGGVAVEMAGSVGSVETPEVYPGPISRVPQAFFDESHPAGCRTLFAPNGTPAPVGYDAETTLLGRDLASAVASSIDHTATWSTSNELWGARRDVCVTLTNQLFVLGAQLGVFAARAGYDDNCTIEHPPAPNGATSGTELKTQVAAFGIGDGEFVSVPGEVFPFTYLRSFLGPDDLPHAGVPLPPWLMPHLHARYRFVDGLGEDMLGYIFPAGNGVGVPGEPGATDGTDRFGCGHSDDSESTGSATGDVVGAGLVQLLDAHGGAPEDIRVGRYVLPNGALSRDPLGTPASIKCDVDTVFSASGPAVAVWVGGRRIVPHAWMSLSGREQSRPDRNTRGWIDEHGARHWLDVFTD